MKKFTRKFGDRYDAYRVKSNEAVFYLIPHIMNTRVDSQVYYSDTIDITELDKFIREHSKTDIPGLRTYQVFVSAVLRTASEKPYANRYVSGRKVFHHRNFTTVMAIKKKGMKEETLVKLPFDLSDSLYEVSAKFNKAVSENKEMSDSNDMDKAVGVLKKLPVGLLAFVIGVLKFLDKRGKVPKALHRVSPFHNSFFITNMGSIGIGPIYHHIYEFGTTSLFLGIGKKYFVNEIDDDGNVQRRHKMDVKFVCDERICDGEYWASVFRKMNFYMSNPEKLLVKNENVVLDDGVDYKGRKEYEEEVGMDIIY